MSGPRDAAPTLSGEESGNGAPLEIAIVVNKANPIESLTAEEVRRLFLRQTLKWPHGVRVRVALLGSKDPLDLFAAWHVKPVRRKILQESVRRALARGDAAAPAGSARRADAAPPAGQSPPAASAGPPIRVLLVDDNAVNLKVGCRIIQKEGCRVDTAVDGVRAIEALRAQAYDLVLMDVQMPVLDGLEATRRIRREWSDGESPFIVAMTANATPEDRAACLDAGMDDYLSKPVRAAALRALLDEAARRKTGAGGTPAGR